MRRARASSRRCCTVTASTRSSSPRCDRNCTRAVSALSHFLESEGTVDHRDQPRARAHRGDGAAARALGPVRARPAARRRRRRGVPAPGHRRRARPARPAPGAGARRLSRPGAGRPFPANPGPARSASHGWRQDRTSPTLPAPSSPGSPPGTRWQCDGVAGPPPASRGSPPGNAWISSSKRAAPAARDDVRRLKAAVEDLKTHYVEAATARPGAPPAGAIDAMLWNESALGRLLRRLAARGAGSHDACDALLRERLPRPPAIPVTPGPEGSTAGRRDEERSADRRLIPRRRIPGNGVAREDTRVPPPRSRGRQGPPPRSCLLYPRHGRLMSILDVHTAPTPPRHDPNPPGGRHVRRPPSPVVITTSSAPATSSRR